MHGGAFSTPARVFVPGALRRAVVEASGGMMHSMAVYSDFRILLALGDTADHFNGLRPRACRYRRRGSARPPFDIFGRADCLRSITVDNSRTARARAAPSHRRNTTPSAHPVRTTRPPGGPFCGNVWSRAGRANCHNNRRDRTSGRGADEPTAFPSSGILRSPEIGEVLALYQLHVHIS